MSKHYIGFEPSDGSDGDAELTSFTPLKLISKLLMTRGPQRSIHSRTRDQLARDFAEIERATAALRKAEPGLEPWAETSVEIRSGRVAVPAVLGMAGDRGVVAFCW